MTVQVATFDQVFIFDLPALCKLDVGEVLGASKPLDCSGKLSPLDACLTAILALPQPRKLGCGIAGDLRLMASAFPHMQAFRHAAGLVELRCVKTEVSHCACAFAMKSSLGPVHFRRLLLLLVSSGKVNSALIHPI